MVVDSKKKVVNLDLDLLRSFIAVAKSGSFARAGEEVCRTQSAVSQQMQRLEQSIGQQLFVSDGRNKILTKHGTKMLFYAQKLLQLNDDVCLAFMNDYPAGTLRIGSPDDTANTILPHLLARFSKSHPQIRIEIIVKRSPFLMEMLKNNEIDLTVSTILSYEYPGITLSTSPSYWFCALDYELNQHPSIPLVVLNEPSIYRNMATQALDEAHIPWHIAYVATTLSGARAAIKAGLGITARSIDLKGTDLRILAAEQGFPALPDMNYYLYISNNNPSEIAKTLYESLKIDHFNKKTY